MSKGQSLKEKVERQSIVDEIATATVGLGLLGTGHTVAAHVRAVILLARRERAVAVLQSRSLTPKPAHHFDITTPEARAQAWADSHEVEL